MSAELPLGQEQAAPLTCSLRSRPFFLASGGSLRALAAPFGEPPLASPSLKRLTIGSVRSGRTSPGWGM